MAEMMMRDQSRAGHVLGGTRIADLPDEVSVRDVIRTRIRGEVAAYNDDPGPVFRGLVQPADAVRHSDGFRMRQPRPLDAESLIAAAEEAIGLGLLRLRIDERPVGPRRADRPGRPRRTHRRTRALGRRQRFLTDANTHTIPVTDGNVYVRVGTGTAAREVTVMIASDAHALGSAPSYR